ASEQADHHSRSDRGDKAAGVTRRIAQTGERKSLRVGIGGEAPQERRRRVAWVCGRDGRERTGLRGREAPLRSIDHKDVRIGAYGDQRPGIEATWDIRGLEDRTVRGKHAEQVQS